MQTKDADCDTHPSTKVVALDPLLPMQSHSGFSSSLFRTGSETKSQARRRTLSCFPVKEDDVGIGLGKPSVTINPWSFCNMDKVYEINENDDNSILCHLELGSGFRRETGDLVPSRELFEIYADEVG